MKQNSKMLTRVDSSLKTPQSTATVQTQDQDLIQKHFIYKEPLEFYKTKNMREHEEKSKMAVKTFWENLNNRPKKKHSISKISSRPTASILSSGTTSASSTLRSAAIPTAQRNAVQPLTKASSSRLTISLNPVQSVNISSVKSTTHKSQSTRTTATQKIKLAQNSKNKSTKASVESSCTTADVQYKEPLKFYKTKDMREHEEKSKWVVQTFWENLNGRSKKSTQSSENTLESQISVNLSEVSGSSDSQTLSIQSENETSFGLTEQVNSVAKDKAIGRSNKDSFLSSGSTSKAALTQTFSRSMVDVNENGVSAATFAEPHASSSGLAAQGPEISVLDADRPLTKISNKRKHSGDGEIGNSKLIKISIPETRRQKEFSMKINLPNRPAPQVGNNSQNIISSGTSKNNVVKSLVQLCTMTLVSNKHRLYKLGDAPYHLLEPILKFCTDEELRQLEEVNSRLIDEDMELWKRFLQQKLPDQLLPDNPEDYRKTYLNIIDEEKEKKERIIGNLRRAMAKEKAKKEARQVKMLLVAPRVPKRKPTGYQKLTPLQKIRREMIREGYVTFPHR
ncbi:RNA polymerase II transcription factor SIII subunit A-domain-containing protein [Glomus cerebriforme]|uniref:Elongin-A n=1 Tax=Glomus cerebriforme TaxID=658196 RepID=A0A397SAE2_9GLOM|nr:RNA polymerase II transcription factor SIII subunit A-domain-containing protein [Glomus cerebriforme]